MLQPSATRTGKQRTAKTPRRLAVLRWLWWLHDFTLGAALSPLSYIYLQYLTGRGMGGYIAVSPTELDASEALWHPSPTHAFTEPRFIDLG